MGKFIIKTSAFLIFVIFFTITIFVFVFSKLEYVPSEMYYSNEFNKAFKEKDFDVIVIGNSKVLSSIEKGVLDSRLNSKSAILGFSSANISISKLTLESYLNKCLSKPKVIFLEVSWFTFNKNRTHFHDISGDLFLRDFLLWRYFFRYYPKILLNIKYSFNRNIKHIIKNESKNLDYSKRNILTNIKEDYVFDQKEFEKVFPTHIAGIDEFLLEDFMKIVELANSLNIKLILFSAPENKNYSLLQKDNLEIKSKFEETALAHKNIFYFDYTYGGKYWLETFESWLKDSQHLNEGKLFTERLLSDLEESGILSFEN